MSYHITDYCDVCPYKDSTFCTVKNIHEVDGKPVCDMREEKEK